MKSRALIVTLLVVCLATPAAAGSLDLAVNNTGISFGNSQEFNGLRFNWRDKDIRKINGVNVTLWAPGKNKRGTINGLSLALIGISSRELNGIQLAGIGMGAERITGINLALIGLGAGEYIHGVGIGLIGLGGEELKGFMLGGLGMGAENIEGIAIGGLGLGAERLRGFGFGLLGVGGSDIKGIVFGGLGVGASEIRGLGIAGLGMGGSEMSGIFFAGLGLGAADMTGLALGGLGVGGDEFSGIGGGLAIAKFGYAKGFTFGAYNRAKWDMIGLQVGLWNQTEYLHGVQIGLLNWVSDNPKWARLLPIMNIRL